MENIESSIGFTREPPVDAPMDDNQLKINLASKINKKEEDIEEERLKTDENWIASSKVIYELSNGVPFDGDDESAAIEGLKLMSHINYNLSAGTIPFAATMATTDLTDVQKIATRYMMQTYDAKNISMDGVTRFAKEVGTDITNLLGVSTLGWGLLGKMAVRTAAKKTLMEATKLNVGNFAKSAYGAAAFEGAVYTAADDAAFQNIKMATGEQDEYSYGQTALSSAIGGLIAPVAMKGLSYGGKQITKGGKFLKDELKAFRDMEPFSYAPDGTPLWDNPGGGTPPTPKPEFYSQLSETLTSTNQKTWNKDQLQGFLAKQGVKAEELKWSGIQDYLDGLDGRAKVSTQDLLEELNPPQLEKTILGGTDAGFDLDKDSFWYKNFPDVKKIADNTDSKEDFIFELENDYSAYTALKKEEPNLDDDEEWASNIANSIYGSEYNPDAQITKYKDYTVKDVGGTNYREELTTIPDTTNKTKLREATQARSEIKTLKVEMEAKDKEMKEAYQIVSKERRKGHTALVEADAPLEEIQKYVKESTALREATTEKRLAMQKDFQKKMGDLDVKAYKVEKEARSDSYKSSHWDQPNVLYHARKQDVDIDGDKTLLIEEIQSDWHQEGRKKGYINPNKDKLQARKLEIEQKGKDASQEEKDEWVKIMNELQPQKEGSSVPQAPYSKTWQEKAMKDQIAEAVEKGYDRVAWVGGKEQAQRYSLSDQVNSVEAFKNKQGKWNLLLDTKKQGEKDIYDLTDEQLADNIGKEMAQKIITDKGGFYEGDGLEIGGEGMKGFYDKMLPKWTNKYIKKYGSKVEVKTLSNGQEVWSFEVTDKMKTDVKGKGQALYSGMAAVGAAGAVQTQEDK